MPYATQSDLIARYGTPLLVQLTDINEPMTGTINATVVDAKLADAGAVIDGHLVGRYTLPLEPVPGILRFHACSIALALLLGSQVTEAAAADYKIALEYLKGVARGDIALLPPQAAVPPAGAGPVLFSPGSKVMGRDAY
jgi:phage gp36-like protein